MIICDGRSELNKEVFTRIAIGKFEGIHLGHRKLIAEMVNSGGDLKNLVFTFSFSSSFVFDNDSHIYSEDERRSIFEGLGVDYLVEYRLDAETAKVDPEAFVRDILVGRLHAREIYCGPDLSFGNRGAGNIDTIRGLSDELGITVHVIEKEKYLGEDISSTRIRNELARHNVTDADVMLGKKKYK